MNSKANQADINKTLEVIAQYSMLDPIVTQRLAVKGPDGGLGKRFTQHSDYFTLDTDPFIDNLSNKERAERFYHAANVAREGGTIKSINTRLKAKRPLTENNGDVGQEQIWMFLAAKCGHTEAQQKIRSTDYLQELLPSIPLAPDIKKYPSVEDKPISIITIIESSSPNTEVLDFFKKNDIFSQDIIKLFKLTENSAERAHRFYQMAKQYEESGDFNKQKLCLAAAAKLGHDLSRKLLLEEANQLTTIEEKNSIRKHLAPYAHQACLLVSSRDEEFKQQAENFNNEFRKKYNKNTTDTQITAIDTKQKFPITGNLRIYIIGHGAPGADSITSHNGNETADVTQFASAIQQKLEGFNFSQYRVHVSVLSCYGANPGDAGYSFASQLATALHQKNLPVEVSGRTEKVIVSKYRGHQEKFVEKPDSSSFESMGKQLIKLREKLENKMNAQKQHVKIINESAAKGEDVSRSHFLDMQTISKEINNLIAQITAIEKNMLSQNEITTKNEKSSTTEDPIIVDIKNNVKTKTEQTAEFQSSSKHYGKMTFFYHPQTNSTSVIQSHDKKSRENLENERKNLTENFTNRNKP